MSASSISTDICIIGAGPAGITASLTLSKLNIRHIVVDASTFPRNKPCADIITSNVLRELNTIDPKIIPSLNTLRKINPIWKTSVYPPNGKKINIDFLPFDRKETVPSCYAISRSEFDLFLVTQAQQSQFASIRQNCRITSVEHHRDHISLKTSDGDTITASIVIVAAGSNSSLVKFFGSEIKPEYCSVGIRAYYRNIDCDINSAELFLDRTIMPGGFYIAPLPDQSFNVNMVIFLEKVRNEHMNLQKVFETVIENNPMLRRKFANAERISPFEGSKMNMGVRRQVISGDRFLIAGDSAALIDIVSGNGIPQAMISGRIAAHHAAKALHEQNFSGAFMKQFETDLYATIDQSMILGKTFYPFLRRKFFSSLIIRLLNVIANRPHTNDLIRDLLYDKNVKAQLLNPKLYFRLLFK